MTRFRKLIFAYVACIATVCSCASPSTEKNEKLDTQTASTPTATEQYKSEIDALADHPKVKAAFETIVALNAETLSDHILLTEIESPPFKEATRAAKFAEMLTKVGADSVWIDGEGNVLALRKGTERNKTIVIEGHMDTVFPEGTDVKVKFKGDTLLAPGVADDTRALAVLLSLLKTMNKHDIQTKEDVIFVGTVGEEGEGDLRGVKYLFGHGPKIDSYIALDGSNIAHITNQGVGSHRYRITFKGPGGHSYGAYGIVNPHVAMAKAMSAWSENASKYIDGVNVKTTYSIGIVGGGTSVNSIPYESWVVVDMRSESAEELEHVDKLLQDAIQAALASVNKNKKSGDSLTVDIDMIGNRPTGKAATDIPLIQHTMASAGHFGKEVTFFASSTNSNTPLSLGIPAVTVGYGGDGGGAHSLAEWWVDGGSADEGAQFCLLLLLSEAGIN